jgi:uncharacterized membrane protein
MFEWKPLLGPFHSVLLHFPIGFLTLTFVLDLIAVIKPASDLRRATRIAMAASVISAVVVAMFGLWRASAGGYDPAILAVHKWAGLAVVALAFATGVAQRAAFGPAPPAGVGALYRGLFVVTLSVLVVAGHYGGTLAHGSTFLVQNAPDFVKQWFVNPTVSHEQAGALYAGKIQPVLRDTCFECHGPERQSGNLRLDTAESAWRGGRSGVAAIVPGAPLRSELVRRLLLLPEEIGVMPPKGKQRLTADEVLEIIDWIERGAPYADSRPADRP